MFGRIEIRTKSKWPVTFDRRDLDSSSFRHSNRETLSFRMVKTRALKTSSIKSYRPFTFCPYFTAAKHTWTPGIAKTQATPPQLTPVHLTIVKTILHALLALILSAVFAIMAGRESSVKKISVV